MNKNHYVLQALKILGLEEILKLATILKSPHLTLKKVVGEDVIVWEGPEQPAPKSDPEADSKVLLFQPRDFKDEIKEVEEGADKVEGTAEHFTPAELMLWQKELTKESDVALQKQDAFKGYKKSAELYVVKSDLNGKEKMRVAATQGVLVNKKQA